MRNTTNFLCFIALIALAGCGGSVSQVCIQDEPDGGCQAISIGGCQPNRYCSGPLESEDDYKASGRKCQAIGSVCTD